MLLSITLDKLSKFSLKKGPIFGALFYLCIGLCFAQEQDRVPSFEEIVETAKPVPENTPILPVYVRANTITIGFQYLSTWIPSKKTLGYTRTLSPKWSLEGEYSTSTLSTGIVGVDLGSVSEKRFSLLGRRYWGRSFNWVIGPYFNSVKAALGGDIKTPVDGHVQVEQLGLSLGFANRWSFENGFTIGFDWLRVNIPLRETKYDDKILQLVADKSSRDDVKTVLSAINRVPTFVLLGIHLGYFF